MIMEEKRRFYNPRSLLPLPAVTEIGRDGVYVDFTEFKPMQVPKQSLSYDQMKQKWSKRSRRYAGHAGRCILSSDTGIIVAYELSDGFCRFVRRQKQIHSSGEPLEVGRSTIVLNE
ncbi:hypothetical protein PO124_20730 [Bacillus licheniformis]|nr:hypothetical protein [Bacillus licheniformis]